MYGLYEDYASCRKAKEAKVTIKNIDKKGEDYHKSANNLLGQFVEFIPSIGYNYKTNPWYGYINQDTTYQTFEDVKNAVRTLALFFERLVKIEEISKNEYGVDCEKISQDRKSVV